MLHTFNGLAHIEEMDFARPPGGCSAQCGTAGSGWGALGEAAMTELQMGTKNQQRMGNIRLKTGT